MGKVVAEIGEDTHEEDRREREGLKIYELDELLRGNFFNCISQI